MDEDKEKQEERLTALPVIVFSCRLGAFVFKLKDVFVRQ